jgi:ABC-type antimicrobial peptide transport system, permease component
MFLALKEMKHAKLRYGLVIGIIFLIAYLVFFLTGLAYGLAQDNRTAVDKWQADDVLLAQSANTNLNMSHFPLTVADEVEAEEQATLAQLPSVIQKQGSEETINATFFGINVDQFLVPKITAGRMFKADNEVVVDDSLAQEYGIALGDVLITTGNDAENQVVGFTHNAKFNVAPVLYTSLTNLEKNTANQQSTSNQMINAIVTRGKVAQVPEGLEKIAVPAFIQALPGYQAQVLTFGFMIGFLIVIAAIVLGIFIYILTMQKVEIFGVMKAQGIASSYIAKAVMAQTFLLAVFGTVIGLLATIGTGLVLPDKVPFALNSLFLASMSGLMIVFAMLGSFFSVRSVVKIDPLKAIG